MLAIKRTAIVVLLAAVLLAASAAPAPHAITHAARTSPSGPLTIDAAVRQQTPLDHTNDAINKVREYSGLSRPVIIGIAIGVTVLVLMLLIACCCCCCGICRK